VRAQTLRNTDAVKTENDRHRSADIIAVARRCEGRMMGDVCSWHKCEVPTGSENVCLSVKAGSDGRMV
jgi:hypothetical protein